MEEVLARFPHLGDKIFEHLDSYSLITCKEVSRIWENFMKVEKSCYLRIIQWYTYRSKSLGKKIVQQFGAAIIVVSILREIFGSNRALPLGWEENCMPAKKMNQWGRATAAETEGRKYYMNHITQSTQWEDPRITVTHGKHQNSQNVTQITGIPTSPLPYDWSWQTTRDGTIYYLNLITRQIIISEWENHYERMIKSQKPSIPQFVHNQDQWELITNPFFLTTKCKQYLLNLEQNKWILAISENFPKCKTGFLLSFFGLDLPEEHYDGLLFDPIDSLLYTQYPIIRNSDQR